MLQVGLDLGVIDHRLFTMLALMAIVTTGATAPLLDRILPAGEPIPLARPRGIGGIRNR